MPISRRRLRLIVLGWTIVLVVIATGIGGPNTDPPATWRPGVDDRACVDAVSDEPCVGGPIGALVP